MKLRARIVLQDTIEQMVDCLNGYHLKLWNWNENWDLHGVCQRCGHEEIMPSAPLSDVEGDESNTL